MLLAQCVLWGAAAHGPAARPFLVPASLQTLPRRPCLRLPPQVTAAQLAHLREREQREMQQLAEQQAAEGKRMVSEDEYAAALAVENKNRCDRRAGMVDGAG